MRGPSQTGTHHHRVVLRDPLRDLDRQGLRVPPCDPESLTSITGTQGGEPGVEEGVCRVTPSPGPVVSPTLTHGVPLSVTRVPSSLRVTPLTPSLGSFRPGGGSSERESPCPSPIPFIQFPPFQSLESVVHRRWGPKVFGGVGGSSECTVTF